MAIIASSYRSPRLLQFCAKRNTVTNVITEFTHKLKKETNCDRLKYCTTNAMQKLLKISSQPHTPKHKHVTPKYNNIVSQLENINLGNEKFKKEFNRLYMWYLTQMVFKNPDIELTFQHPLTTTKLTSVTREFNTQSPKVKKSTTTESNILNTQITTKTTAPHFKRVKRYNMMPDKSGIQILQKWILIEDINKFKLNEGEYDAVHNYFNKSKSKNPTAHAQVDLSRLIQKRVRERVILHIFQQDSIATH